MEIGFGRGFILNFGVLGKSCGCIVTVFFLGLWVWACFDMGLLELVSPVHLGAIKRHLFFLFPGFTHTHDAFCFDWPCFGSLILHGSCRREFFLQA